MPSRNSSCILLPSIEQILSALSWNLAALLMWRHMDQVFTTSVGVIYKEEAEAEQQEILVRFWFLESQAWSNRDEFENRFSVNRGFLLNHNQNFN